MDPYEAFRAQYPSLLPESRPEFEPNTKLAERLRNMDALREDLKDVEKSFYDQCVRLAKHLNGERQEPRAVCSCSTRAFKMAHGPHHHELCLLYRKSHTTPDQWDPLQTELKAFK